MPQNKCRAAAVLFAFGAVLYPCIEILWRGYTHPSMALLGGACTVMVWFLYDLFREVPLPLRALAGAGVVCLLEFITGVICNRFLGLGVWDYTNRRFHILGQVCLLYAFFWYILVFLVFFAFRRLDLETHRTQK